MLLPKCPLCFTAYGSALGALGLSPAADQRLVEPLIVAAVVMSFGLVLVLAVRRRDALTPLVSAIGATLVLAGRFGFDVPTITTVGAVLLAAAAIRNSVLCAGQKPSGASPTSSSRSAIS